MPTYDIKVIVEYNYSTYAESEEEAEKEGWKFEDYAHFAEVESISVSQQDEFPDEDEDLSDPSDTIQESNPN